MVITLFQCNCGHDRAWSNGLGDRHQKRQRLESHIQRSFWQWTATRCRPARYDPRGYEACLPISITLVREPCYKKSVGGHVPHRET